MKGSWFIELDNDILTSIQTIYHNTPQKITIPLGFGIFDEDDYNLFKTWLDREIQIPLAGVIVLSELGLQLLKFNIPETLLKDFGKLDSPATSQCAVLSYKSAFDPDILFKKIEVNTSYCQVTSLTGKIKFHSL